MRAKKSSAWKILASNFLKMNYSFSVAKWGGKIDLSIKAIWSNWNLGMGIWRLRENTSKISLHAELSKANWSLDCFSEQWLSGNMTVATIGGLGENSSHGWTRQIRFARSWSDQKALYLTENRAEVKKDERLQRFRWYQRSRKLISQELLQKMVKWCFGWADGTFGFGHRYQLCICYGILLPSRQKINFKWWPHELESCSKRLLIRLFASKYFPAKFPGFPKTW